jgi:hypothetical protein
MAGDEGAERWPIRGKQNALCTRCTVYRPFGRRDLNERRDP